jgi:phosphoglycerate dehydrogenase-like enzyme
MIGEKEIAMMKDGVRIINCARGGLIDEKALCAALQSGKVAGAALDVFEEEPAVANPLCALPNVIVTPTWEPPQKKRKLMSLSRLLSKSSVSCPGMLP